MSTTNIHVESIAGTRDFYPADMAIRNWEMNIWRKASLTHGCEEYDAPIIERTELWERKAGDDVTNEMYAFVDKDGQKLCLRPEMTPSLCRLLITHLPAAALPLRWYSLPQCWRHEDITRGRKREFYQWNMDIIGGDEVKSDLETVSTIVSSLKMFGLDTNDAVVYINNRQILQKVLNSLGVGDDKFEVACNIIDKFNKLSKEELTARLSGEIGMNFENARKIFDLMEVRSIDKVAELLGDDDDTVKKMRKFFELAKDYGIADWLEFNASVVRGLSYYTGIVMEGFCKNPNVKRAFCGGGRYDNLLSTYGYPEKVSGVGFGMGDVVIVEILKELGKLPTFEDKIDDMVFAFNDDLYGPAVQVSQKLRAKGRTVDLYIKGGKFKKALNYADRKGISRVIFIAPDEWANGEVTIKNLRETDKDKKQELVKFEDL